MAAGSYCNNRKYKVLGDSKMCNSKGQVKIIHFYKTIVSTMTVLSKVLYIEPWHSCDIAQASPRPQGHG